MSGSDSELSSLKDRVTEMAARMEGQFVSSPKALATELRKLASAIDCSREDDELGPPRKKKKKPDRPFDFSKYRQRFVVMELSYVGWKYSGFAAQDNTNQTIEAYLFDAFRKTKLVPPGDWDIAGLRYSRCGRTDSGVSALGQVIALLVRSKATVDEPEPDVADELDYPKMLNRALPDDIRILAWGPAPEGFSARFSATHREYKYFLVQRGQLDIDAMSTACRYFLGEHDFRNFCKVDIKSGVTNFMRTIMECEIVPVPGHSIGAAQLYAFRVKGTAFLYHQVRCMVAVLLMVGQGLEQPSIVQQLLDLAVYPRKPQLNMAPEEPLLLYSCGFNGLQWVRQGRETTITADILAGMVDHHLLSAGLIAQQLSRVQADRICIPGETEMPSTRPMSHVPLRRRPTEPSFAERQANAQARAAAGQAAVSEIGPADGQEALQGVVGGEDEGKMEE